MESFGRGASSSTCFLSAAASSSLIQRMVSSEAGFMQAPGLVQDLNHHFVPGPIKAQLIAGLV